MGISDWNLAHINISYVFNNAIQHVVWVFKMSHCFDHNQRRTFYGQSFENQLKMSTSDGWKSILGFQVFMNGAGKDSGYYKKI